MNEQDQDIKNLSQCGKVKELVKSDVFRELLQILALKIKELDTVRDIKDENSNDAIIEQLARKLAIEKIESWLIDILGIYDFDKYIDKEIESQNDIIKRLEEKKND